MTGFAISLVIICIIGILAGWIGLNVDLDGRHGDE